MTHRHLAARWPQAITLVFFLALAIACSPRFEVIDGGIALHTVGPGLVSGDPVESWSRGAICPVCEPPGLEPTSLISCAAPLGLDGR